MIPPSPYVCCHRQRDRQAGRQARWTAQTGSGGPAAWLPWAETGMHQACQGTCFASLLALPRTQPPVLWRAPRSAARSPAMSSLARSATSARAAVLPRRARVACNAAAAPVSRKDKVRPSGRAPRRRRAGRAAKGHAGEGGAHTLCVWGSYAAAGGAGRLAQQPLPPPARCQSGGRCSLKGTSRTPESGSLLAEGPPACPMPQTRTRNRNTSAVCVPWARGARRRARGGGGHGALWDWWGF